jgi:DNA-binding MarR family transcriptional regulator
MDAISFYEKFEKARSLQTAQFEQYGLKGNPFTPFLPENAKASLVDRRDEENQFIADFTRLLSGEISHIFIRAKRGFGKSHFLYYLYEEVKSSHELMGIPSPMFFDSPSALKKWLGQKPDTTETKYLFIDDASIFSSGNVSESEYIRSVYKGSNIRTINAWQDSLDISVPYRLNPSDFTEAFEDITLDALELEDDVSLLERRVSLNKLPGKQMDCFDRSFFRELHAISYGNPRLLLQNASKCLLENLGRVARFTDEEVVAYCQVYGKRTTLQMQEALNKLTPSQKRILVAISAITKVKSKTECTMRELSKLLQISKPAVISSMHPLLEAGFVLSREGPRLTKWYSLSKDFKDYIEERFGDDIKVYVQKQEEVLSKVIQNELF